MSHAILAFPPIVETNFGGYYPSTAYLAASLKCSGHDVRQIDLNEDFALWLTQPEQLARFGAGDFFPWEQRAPAALECVASRILAKNRSKLFDAGGRHMFSDRNEAPSYLLQWLGSAFRTDELISEIVDRIVDGDPRARFWQTFASDRLGSKAPDLLGVSIPMGTQILPGLCLAKAARDIWPNTRTVLGGPAISLMDDEDLAYMLRRCSFVDAVVRFDGERPLATLAGISGRNEWLPERVPGVAVKSTGHALFSPPEMGLPLNQLPVALYERELLAALHDPVFGVIQARGCYWGNCAYCDFIELYKGSPKYRQRPIEVLTSEMAALIRDYGAKRFSLITEALPPAYARRLSDVLIDGGMDVRWSSFVMVHHHFDQGLFRRLAESGCERLIVGLETMTDRVLALVGKHADAATNEAFVNAAGAAGIPLTINLIPDLPSTTAQEAMEALNRLKDLADKIDTISIFPFEATRSSAIGRDPLQYGLVPGGKTANQAQYASNRLEWSDPAMTPMERAEVHSLYSAFARYVNGRKTKKREVTLTCVDSVVVDMDGIDICHSGDNAQVFDWRRRELVLLPADLATLLSELTTGQVLDGKALAGVVGDERTNEFFRILEQTGALQMPA